MTPAATRLNRQTVFKPTIYSRMIRFHEEGKRLPDSCRSGSLASLAPPACLSDGARGTVPAIVLPTGEYRFPRAELQAAIQRWRETLGGTAA